jgi:hypothetical protein
VWRAHFAICTAGAVAIQKYFRHRFTRSCGQNAGARVAAVVVLVLKQLALEKLRVRSALRIQKFVMSLRIRKCVRNQVEVARLASALMIHEKAHAEHSRARREAFGYGHAGRWRSSDSIQRPMSMKRIHRQKREARDSAAEPMASLLVSRTQIQSTLPLSLYRRPVR